MGSSSLSNDRPGSSRNKFSFDLLDSWTTAERKLFYVLATVALIYAFAAGLKTVGEWDLGWQMATGRWIVEHHQIPSTEVFSYTAAGQPWIYPVGAELVFYGAFLLGGYALLSWIVAAASVGTVALLLRRGSLVSAALAILAGPVIASRMNPRAEVFTLVLFAATLSLLWQQQESGDARLWLLPLLMAAWVNLHPGFAAGLVLVGAYALLEVLKMLWPGERAAAAERLRRSWPWLAATGAATLINPWGARIYEVLERQNAGMQTYTQIVLEWVPIPMNWARIKSVVLLRDPDPVYVLLVIGAVAVVAALWRRQLGAAVLMAGFAFAALRHLRFKVLFAIAVVIVGGAVLDSVFRLIAHHSAGKRIRLILALAATVALAGLGAKRVTDLVSDRTYVSGASLSSFGAGESWWFPEGAATFIEREHLPGQIFNTNNEGGYFVWRLGPEYRDYIDGRAVPFGRELLLRNATPLVAAPSSPAWQYEVERYDINVMLIPIGRFVALQFFPALKQYCESDSWRPVYLDEVSVVFLRRRPETEGLIQRLQLDCSTAPLPKVPPQGTGTEAFNKWANAASVLHALGRDEEAMAASAKALTIFPDSAYIYWTRAHMLEAAGNLRQAEAEYQRATKLEPNSEASWTALATFYQSQARWPEASHAWQSAADVSLWPWDPLVNLGYANLLAHRPKEALAAFDDAAGSLPADADLLVNNAFLANLAHGRARSCYYLGDLRRAIAFEEEAARLLPGSADLWRQLADLYDLAGRREDANKIRSRRLAGSSGGEMARP